MAAGRRLRAWCYRAVALFVAVLVFAALMLPAVRAAREAARRQERVNNLKQMWLGLHNWQDVYKCMPPTVRRDKDGRTLCSWRFAVWPFLEAIMMDIDFSEPWDSPKHRWLAERAMPIFCWFDTDSAQPAHTSGMAVAGRGTAFDESRRVALADLDGDTILLVEVAHSGVHWMQPGDIDVDRLPESLAEGVDGRGISVLFSDGAIWHLKPDVPLDELKKFFTIKGAKQFDREQVLAPYAMKQ